MSKFFTFFIIFFPLLFILFSCGPIQTTQSIIRAEEAVRTAKLMDAPQYAPYEWTKAKLYLDMAKEKQGFSEFEASVVFAEQALSEAENAKTVTAKNIRLKKIKEEKGLKGGGKQ